MSRVSPWLLVGLIATVVFTSATGLELRRGKWNSPAAADGPLKRLLGEGRKMFANQFVVMADVYLHSGYYPSIFDRPGEAANPPESEAEGERADQDHEHHGHDAEGKCLHGDAHEREMSFQGEPRNWLEAFIRRFRITEHTHLDGGEVKEMLPWLRLAIETDPHEVDTYVTTAYWLRSQLDRPAEAENILREGMRNNPRSPELLFEMGVLFEEARREPDRARNLWKKALVHWQNQSDEEREHGRMLFEQITTRLGRLEASQGQWEESVRYYELAKGVSPRPESIQERIDEVRARARVDNAPARQPVP